MISLYLGMLETEDEINLFEQIYHSNRKLMLKIALDIVPSGWAEDAVHNAFIRIAKHVELFSSISCNERRSLCVTIVRNVSRNMLRDSHPDRMSYLEDSLNEPVDAVSIDEEVLRVERLADIERCIGLLPPDLRDVVNLRLVLEYDTKETADILDITQEAVRTRLHRARAKLMEAMKKEGITYGQ